MNLRDIKDVTQQMNECSKNATPFLFIINFEMDEYIFHNSPSQCKELLCSAQISEREIKASDICKYDSVMLINGMIDLGEVVVNCHNIL